MCEEESDDQEAVAKLFEINDSIHRTIERYKLIKKGDLEAASKIPKGTLGTSTGVIKNADNELSLIDFGGEPEISANGGSASKPKTDNLEDDLLGLSFQDQSYGQGGGIALGFGANTSIRSCVPTFEGAADQVTDIPGPSLLSSTVEQSSAKAPTPSRTPQPQQPIPMKPNYDVFASFAKSRPVSQTTTPVPQILQQPQHAPPPPQPSDPFAALSSSSGIPRQGSPFTQPPHNKPSTSMFDFASSTSQPAQRTASHIPVAQNSNGASADDDWNFSSALPEDSLPSSNSLTVSSKEVQISFDISRRKTDDTIIDILAKFTNKSANPITEYTFQVAVTKVCGQQNLSITPVH